MSSFEIIQGTLVRLIVGALALIIVVGTPLYLFFNFGAVTMAGICITLLIAAFIQYRTHSRRSKSPHMETSDQDERLSPIHVTLATLCACMCAISLAILFTHATHESILGPWAATPPVFFTVVFLQVLLLVTAIMRGLPSRYALPLVSLNGGVLLGIIPLLFPLGFGFDPVIHQQAAHTILTNGFIDPKTLTYTGQYVLMVFLAKLFSVPIDALDRLLVPALAIISIPPFAYHAFRALRCEKRASIFASFGIVLLLIPVIESPTPWGFSVLLITLLTLESILFFVYNGKVREFFFLLLIALAILCIHPIAGLPALAYCVACLIITSFPQSRTLIKWSALAVLILAGGLAVPAAFIVYAHVTNLPLPLGLNLPSPEIVNFSIPWRFDALLDSLYGLALLTPVIGFLFWIIGIRRALQCGSPALRNASSASVCIAAMCLISYVVLRFFFSFDFLIGYEQFDYTDRFLVLLVIFSSPWILAPLAHLSERALTQANPLIRGTALITIAALTIGAVYLAYPRNDAYTSFHGYNFSAADLDAVRWIQNDAQDEPYVTLSNQVTAGAAIKEYGFAHYLDFKTDAGTQKVFYYPIPTSSPLYQFFLSMMDIASKATMEDAMQRAGVYRAYFVVHRYEPRAPNIVKTAKQSADQCASIGSGTVSVCVYSRTRSGT